MPATTTGSKLNHNMSSKARNSTQRQSLDKQVIPDLQRLMDLSSSPKQVKAKMATTNGTGPNDLNYENSIDLNEITRRQLDEDINAYRYDLDFCRQQLMEPDLTPQETRTIQLRVLDMGHQIRHCQHRIELIDGQARQSGSCKGKPQPLFHFDSTPRRQSIGPSVHAGVKRPRLSKGKPSESENEEVIEVNADGSTSLQRLGFWKCHLCTSQKYLLAGSNRVPSAPCKWPLKDVSKMLNHFLDMHTEHDPDERCMELGAALDANRGPLKYWLTRTRSQNLGDGSIVDEIIHTLQAGQLPAPLRNLNRAAAAFPNSAPGTKKEEDV